MANLQMAMFAPKSEWVPPLELPDITAAGTIAIDVETRDPNLKRTARLANKRWRGHRIRRCSRRVVLLPAHAPLRRGVT